MRLGEPCGAPKGAAARWQVCQGTLEEKRNMPSRSDREGGWGREVEGDVCLGGVGAGERGIYTALALETLWRVGFPPDTEGTWRKVVLYIIED